MSEVSPGDINRIMGENRHQTPIPIGAMTLCQGAVSAKRYGVYPRHPALALLSAASTAARVTSRKRAATWRSGRMR